MKSTIEFVRAMLDGGVYWVPNGSFKFYAILDNDVGSPFVQENIHNGNISPMVRWNEFPYVEKFNSNPWIKNDHIHFPDCEMTDMVEIRFVDTGLVVAQASTVNWLSENIIGWRLVAC